jgi:hypothetical protein
MWDRKSLQLTLLGSPACGDPRQIFFGADHIDRRQLELCAYDEKRITNNETRIGHKAAASGSIRFSFFGLR